MSRSFPDLVLDAGAYEVIDGDRIRAPYCAKDRLLGFDAPRKRNAMVNWRSADGRPSG